LFIHETKRAFEDRMINFDDINKFRNYFKAAVNEKIGDDYSELVMNKNILFTSFINQHNGGEKVYLPIDDINQLNQCL